MIKIGVRRHFLQARPSRRGRQKWGALHMHTQHTCPLLRHARASRFLPPSPLTLLPPRSTACATTPPARPALALSLLSRCAGRHATVWGGALRRAVQGVMAPGPQLLSEEQLRRTWSLIDILTMLKRRGNLPPPTAELILRKFDGLSLLALDNLSMLMEYTIAEQGRRLCPDQVCAMAQAVRVFPEDTASEIAHAHACESVASADGVKRESHEGSHLLRLPTLPDTPHAELPEPVCRVENVVSLHTRGGIPHPSPWAPGGIPSSPSSIQRVCNSDPPRIVAKVARVQPYGSRYLLYLYI
jgi:hypothetical protein